MPHEEIHSKLLRAAAREFLSPLGVRQKGRSRTWLDDNRWWLCIVEFQPSSFSRGSFLNVGCMWLWHEQDYLSFDECYRAENFVPFRTPDQFELVAQEYAQRAAAEVQRYRSLFATVSDVADYYIKRRPTEFWSSFHAAVSCGSVGLGSASRRFFEQVLRWRDDRDWVKSAQAEAAVLNAILDDTDMFRQKVWDRVNRTRELLKMSQAINGEF